MQPTTIKSGDPRNDIAPQAPKGYSKFDLTHRFLQTHRFGEVTPHESFETVKGAKDSIRLMSDTSSLSLKAPLKTEMFQKRVNFFVPLQAIIRNNWELLVAQPSQGDDVADNVDGVVRSSVLNYFFERIVSAIRTISSSWPEAPSVTLGDYLTGLLRNLLIGEMFWSQGSLNKQLYFDFSHCIRVSAGSAANNNLRFVSYDVFLERVLSAIAPRSSEIEGVHRFRLYFRDERGYTVDGYTVVPNEILFDNPTADDSDHPYISYRHALDLCRQNLNFYISNVVADSDLDLVIDAVDEAYEVSLTTDLRDYLFGEYLDSQNLPSLVAYVNLVENINFDKVSAYQICCAHFFSLDHVDYIYSAELYRQLMQYYWDAFCNYSLTIDDQLFAYNGLKLRYDALSGYVMEKLLFDNHSVIFHDIEMHGSSEEYIPAWSYLTALFSFRHSLRYLDYFTGGRTQPLSVGSNSDPRANINVSVNAGAVNGVEMILAQNAARYLNFAQRVGRKVSQWLDQMFPGGMPKPDFHDPQWLSATGDALSPEQTQNTGAGQLEDAQSITARFKADSNNYMFTIQPDRPGYIICVTYYDVPRAYAFATARENMHCNRYDRFNPFLQYNGSQPVHKQEIGIAGDTPFSYQGRYEEYKQNYDVASGGFVEFLPGFAFIADKQSGLPMQQNLNPSYVRSWNCELDPFYLALTGYGLAAYFHFIVKNVNIIQGVRPMEYAPQLM